MRITAVILPEISFLFTRTFKFRQICKVILFNTLKPFFYSYAFDLATYITMINFMDMTLPIPEAKLHEVQSIVSSFNTQPAGTKSQVESLVT